jgi:hypothetical protein
MDAEALAGGCCKWATGNPVHGICVFQNFLPLLLSYFSVLRRDDLMNRCLIVGGRLFFLYFLGGIWVLDRKKVKLPIPKLFQHGQNVLQVDIPI